jgi:hypothetical protein
MLVGDERDAFQNLEITEALVQILNDEGGRLIVHGDGL